MNDLKEEIKARLAVEDVISQYIELTRAGKNLKGRSPWGVDRTPSFMVSPDKGIWHDFSANKGGDIFTFLMEVEGISFKEALEKLAHQAGVEIKRYQAGDRANQAKKTRALACLELACKYYQFCLSKNRSICDYVFYQRHLNRATLKTFRIGYAPQAKSALTQFLYSKGYTKADLDTAGLINRFGGDLFQGRMMIPFLDNSGKVIGFTGRIIKQGEPKYLNTPDTLLFNKSRFIFGLFKAKEAILRHGFSVIVEGNMDVISSHQAGIDTAVATSGTAMTQNHLKILSRFSPDIRLAYDGDAAGVKAAERAIQLASQLGLNLSIIHNYHGAKDPDELIQRDPTLWQTAVNTAMPAVEWLLLQYEQRLDLTTGSGKRDYSTLAMQIINQLPDPVEKRHYEQLVAKKLQVQVGDLRAKQIKQHTKVLRKVKQTADPQSLKALRQLEDNILAIALYGGTAAANFDLSPLQIPTSETRVLELELIWDQQYKTWTADALISELTALFARFQAEFAKVEITKLTAALKKVDGDEPKTQIILQQIHALQDRLKIP